MTATWRAWTAAEDAILRDHYRDMPTKALAVKVGRTVAAVLHRTKHLGLRKARTWTAEQDAIVTEGWGKVNVFTLAGRTGRSPSAIKNRAFILGLDAGNRYTDEEKDLVRQLYPTHTAAQIAAQIAERIHGTPRSALSIYRLASTLGLRKLAGHEAEFVEQVRALHADGLNDFEIAARLGRHRDTVHPIRAKRLKLSPNQEGIDRGHAKAVTAQLKSMGLTSPTQLRTRAYRRYAVENGWPEDFLPREVQILNVLARDGPLTALQITERIGMRVHKNSVSGKLKLLSGCNRKKPNGVAYGTYTASLMARGMICHVDRSQSWSIGPPRLPGLYMLTELACQMIEARTQTKEAS